MATCRDLVRRAMRMIAQLEAGGEPEAIEASDALESLQSLINGLPAVMLGGPWIEVDTATDYEAGEDERVRITDFDASVDVTLPETIDDPNVDGGVRAPRNGARVQIIGEVDGEDYRPVYVYISYLGEWVRIDALTLSSDNPFGPEHDDGLAAMLAVRMAPEFGATVTAEVTEMALRGRVQLNTRLSPRFVTEAEYF